MCVTGILLSDFKAHYWHILVWFMSFKIHFGHTIYNNNSSPVYKLI